MIYTPYNVTFEITLNCQLKCKHCYNFDRSSEKPKASRPPLSTDELCNAIDEVTQAGALYITFTGGDPFLHPDLLQLIKRVRRNHSVARLKTNALAITPKVAKKLREFQVSELDVTLYGNSEETYADFTSVPHAAYRAKKGIVAALSEGIKVNLNIQLHRHNIDELGTMIDFAKDHQLDPAFAYDISTRYDGTKNSLDHFITAAQFRSLLRGPYRNYFLVKNERGELRCSCAKKNCGINLWGDVYPCIGAPIYSGSIREKSFKEIWNNSPVFNQIRNHELKDFKTCFSCSDRYYCLRSSGNVYTNTGNYTGADSLICEQAKIRKEEMETSH